MNEFAGQPSFVSNYGRRNRNLYTTDADKRAEFRRLEIQQARGLYSDLSNMLVANIEDKTADDLFGHVFIKRHDNLCEFAPLLF